MHMFDPARPRTAHGMPQLLIEGSAVPHVIAAPQANGWISFSVMLRNYSDDKNRSYGYRFARLPPQALATFFEDYMTDPEGALKTYFLWQAQPEFGIAKRMPTSIRPEPDLAADDLL